MSSCIDLSNLSEQIQPIEAYVNISYNLFTLTYRVFTGPVKLYVYANNDIVDRNGSSGKEYQTADAMLLNKFAVIPVPIGDDSPTYDPLCGARLSLFPIRRNAILPEEKYVCPAPPIYDSHGDPNFIPTSYKQLAITVYKGKNTHVLTSNSKPARAIVGIQDYRFVNQFDVRAFRVNRTLENCIPYRLPARSTAVFASIQDGVYPVSQTK
jgi:hypothetical protein